MGETSEPEEQIKYASFLYRMMASFIDNLLSLVVLMPLFSIADNLIGFTKPAALGPNPTYNDIFIALQESLPSLTFQSIIVALVVIIFWKYKSATPGKMLLKMKIVDAKTGGKPSNGQLIARYLGYFVSVIPFCLGFVWIYYDKKKQGFHDKIARTVVIKE